MARNHKSEDDAALGRLFFEVLCWVQIVVRDEIPLAYLPGGVARVHIRVVGDLRESECATTLDEPPPMPQPAPQSTPKAALPTQQCVVDSVSLPGEASSSAADEMPHNASIHSEHAKAWEQQASLYWCPVSHHHLLYVQNCTAMHHRG